MRLAHLRFSLDQQGQVSFKLDPYWSFSKHSSGRGPNKNKWRFDHMYVEAYVAPTSEGAVIGDLNQAFCPVTNASVFALNKDVHCNAKELVLRQDWQFDKFWDQVMLTLTINLPNKFAVEVGIKNMPRRKPLLWRINENAKGKRSEVWRIYPADGKLYSADCLEVLIDKKVWTITNNEGIVTLTNPDGVLVGTIPLLDVEGSAVKNDTPLTTKQSTGSLLGRLFGWLVRPKKVKSFKAS